MIESMQIWDLVDLSARCNVTKNKWEQVRIRKREWS